MHVSKVLSTCTVTRVVFIDLFTNLHHGASLLAKLWICID